MIWRQVMNKVKIICVNAYPDESLTTGKIYNAKESKFYYEIINDRGDIRSYLKFSVSNVELDLPSWITFLKLEDWRQRQLNSIDIK